MAYAEHGGGGASIMGVGQILADIAEREGWITTLNELKNIVNSFAEDLVECRNQMYVASKKVEDAGSICGRYSFDDGKIKERARELTNLSADVTSIISEIDTAIEEINVEIEALRTSLRLILQTRTSSNNNKAITTQGHTSTLGKPSGSFSAHRVLLKN